MNKQKSFDTRQLRHDLKGLVEPLQTVKMLLDSGRIEQAVSIHTAALDALKKLVKRVDDATDGERGGQS